MIWRYIPDLWDAAEELSAGRIDWWELRPLDFAVKLEQDHNLRTVFPG